MLIRTTLPAGHTHPQLTRAPITTYADFLNFFRAGQTIDDNTHLTTETHVHNAMFKTAVASGHLTKTKNIAISNECLVDVVLTRSGSDLIQNVFDRTFCEVAINEARNSIAEDSRPHPYVGVVIVKGDTVLATGYRGESGSGDHGEYCALKKLDEADVHGATVYTTLEPCSIRKPPKQPCTKRLIDSKVARVVYGIADKHESVFGHATLVEAGIEIGHFPIDLMPDLLALNKQWSDSLRVQPIVPPNDTDAIAFVSYYTLGTSMLDNIRMFVRPPSVTGGFYTIEDAVNNVLAHGHTLEEIAMEWQRLDRQNVIAEKRIRQSSGGSHQLLRLL